jgi:hypothetical protein
MLQPLACMGFSLHRPRNGRASAGPRSAQWLRTNGGPTGEWSISCRPSRARGGFRANRKPDFAGGVSASGASAIRLTSRIISSTLRKLLAKSGSPSRRHRCIASIGTSFARRRSKATSFRSIADGPQRSTAAIVPPASGRSGRISTSPQRPVAEQQARRHTLNQLRGHCGAMKAAIIVVHKRENGGVSFKLSAKRYKRGPEVQAEAM